MCKNTCLNHLAVLRRALHEKMFFYLFHTFAGVGQRIISEARDLDAKIHRLNTACYHTCISVASIARVRAVPQL